MQAFPMIIASSASIPSPPVAQKKKKKFPLRFSSCSPLIHSVKKKKCLVLKLEGKIYLRKAKSDLF